jgi:hypothetical protein
MVKVLLKLRPLLHRHSLPELAVLLFVIGISDRYLQLDHLLLQISGTIGLSASRTKVDRCLSLPVKEICRLHLSVTKLGKYPYAEDADIIMSETFGHEC